MNADAPRPKLLLLHGYFAGRAAWDRIRTELQDEPVDIIAPDLLGYGEHRRVPLRDVYSLDHIVEHLAPLVERERPNLVVGHSMGGMVSLGLDRIFPGQLERIGVVGLPVFTSAFDGKAHQMRRGRRYVIYMKTHGFSHYGCGIVHGTRPLWMPFAHHFAPRQPRSIFETVFNHSRDAHNRGLTHVAFGGLVPDLSREVTAQVYMLHGRSDRTAPLDRAEALATERGWDFETVARANHQVIVERPAAVADWIRRKILARNEGIS